MKRFNSKQNYTVLLIVFLGAWCIYFYISNEASMKNHNTKTLSFFESQPEELPPPSVTDHYKWKSSSPYTIVSYFSMDCEHCKAVDLLENKNREKYQKSFSLIYRHSPLAAQPLSFGKAVIAECVYRKSGDKKMFAFIADVYKKYDTFLNTNDEVKNIAYMYVENKNNLDECLQSKAVTKEINEQKIRAVLYGVTGTPTFGLFKNNILIARFDQVGEGSAARLMNYVSELDVQQK